MTDFTTIEARKSLAAKYAVKYGIDTALLCALIEQESSWNPWSMRYEEHFYGKYIQPLVNNGKVTNLTEARARATSYGLMQIMGQVAREQSFTGRFMTELCDPDVGLEYGCRKLLACIRSVAPGANYEALQRYNGGGDPNYGHMVLDRISKYQ